MYQDRQDKASGTEGNANNFQKKSNFLEIVQLLRKC